jgi:homoaconitate hydratase
MPQNLVEKIAQRYALDLEPGQQVHAGDFIFMGPAHVMTHDNTGAVIPKFRSIGATAMHNPDQPVFALDHNVQDTSEANQKKYAGIEAFAKEMGVRFHPAGRGIGHQIMVEEGFAWPGTLVVASDSHSNMYGGIGCLGTPVVRTDAASIWATGRTWWQIPPVLKVILNGTLQEGVTGKDLILSLCQVFSKDEALNHAVEFSGAGLDCLSIEQRLSVANMTTEWGALAGLFPIDSHVMKWLEGQVDPSHPRMNPNRLATLATEQLQPDSDATYAASIEVDLDSIRPMVAGPHSVKIAESATTIAKKKLTVQRAYLVSCVNARLGDLADAAHVLQGKQISADVDLLVSAASSKVQQQAEEQGIWKMLQDAGARFIPPGCGPCIGLGTGLLEKGERAISATNRNFKGRMGHPDAESYLASPAIVAASALAGYITTPFEHNECTPRMSHKAYNKKLESSEVKLLPNFPKSLKGRLVFCPPDNLNTDGIYAGKWTYKDDMGPADQAAVVMENHDPEFRQIAKSGDFLLGGFNFGTGSSREQAATALMHFGIQLVLAGSFSETYKRNALNNGFLPIEAPELLSHLKAQFGEDHLTLRLAQELEVDFANSKLIFDGHTFNMSPVGAAAQDLVIQGGLESWVQDRLAKK